MVRNWRFPLDLMLNNCLTKGCGLFELIVQYVSSAKNHLFPDMEDMF